LNSKKKVEKTLAALMKSVRQKEEGEIKHSLESYDMASLKASMAKSARQFKMPYNITCVAF
jgi:hypothetical protein